MAKKDLNYSNIDERQAVSNVANAAETLLSGSNDINLRELGSIGDFISSLRAFSKLKAQCAPCRKAAMEQGVNTSEVKDENMLDKLLELQIRHKALMENIDAVRVELERMGANIPALIKAEREKWYN